MGRFSKEKLSSRSCRISTMIALTSTFFFVEIVVGYMTNSVALVADSFHMLSDVVSLIIGLYAVRIAKRSTSTRNTYGWIRAEVLGALVNGVFLLALSFAITVEAVQRFFEIEEIEEPKLLLVVGGVGLGINLIGLLLFADHAHSHGGGGGGHGHSHGGGSKKQKKESDAGHGHGHGHGDDDAHGGHGHAHAEAGEGAGGKKKGQMNMHGVFLHVLGDALGSVAVMVSALVVWLTEWSGRFYLDPILSLVIVVIIAWHAVPLVRQSSLILLQALPYEFDVDELREQLQHLQGIVDVHELHIWQLAEEKLIASVHVTVQDRNAFMDTASEMKRIFHDTGIHSSTIQPEFVVGDGNESDLGDETTCLLACAATTECQTNVCCNEEKRLTQRRRRRHDEDGEDGGAGGEGELRGVSVGDGSIGRVDLDLDLRPVPAAAMKSPKSVQSQL